MAHALATETLIEKELERLDDRQIRDLAIIGFDKVKQQGQALRQPFSDQTIADLKSNPA